MGRDFQIILGGLKQVFFVNDVAVGLVRRRGDSLVGADRKEAGVLGILEFLRLREAKVGRSAANDNCQDGKDEFPKKVFFGLGLKIS